MIIPGVPLSIALPFELLTKVRLNDPPLIQLILHSLIVNAFPHQSFIWSDGEEYLRIDLPFKAFTTVEISTAVCSSCDDGFMLKV